MHNIRIPYIGRYGSTALAGSLWNGKVSLQSFYLPDSLSVKSAYIVLNATATSAVAQSYTGYLAIYSRTNTTITLIMSASLTLNRTGSASTMYTINFGAGSSTLSAGQYSVLLMNSWSSNVTSPLQGIRGASLALYQNMPAGVKFWGSWSTTTSSPPASMAVSDMSVGGFTMIMPSIILSSF